MGGNRKSASASASYSESPSRTFSRHLGTTLPVFGCLSALPETIMDHIISELFVYTDSQRLLPLFPHKYVQGYPLAFAV